MEKIIIEILEKSHKVRERVKFDTFPIQIGRSYQNDVILDDEYVSPEHFVIEKDNNNNLVVKDLNSENGLFIPVPHKRIAELTLSDDNLLRVGNTLLRIRQSDYIVPPTTVDKMSSIVARQAIRTPWIFLLMMFAISGIMFLNAYWNGFTDPKPLKIFAETVLPVILIWVVWSGIWSLASKIFTQRALYFGHAIFAGSAMLAYLFLQALYDYLAFISSGHLLVDVLEILGFILIVGSLLYAHLRACTFSKPKLLIAVTYSFASTILAILILVDYVRSIEFSDRLDYPTGLKSNSFKLTRSQSIDQFIKESEPLRDKVVKSAKENDY